jgi:hypothetical protein
MASPIANVTQAPAVIDTTKTQAAKPAASQKATQSQATTSSNPPNDTVKISTAAQTAVQEALEIQATTLREAAKGDPQAARLLAKEAAAQKNAE